MILCGGKSTRMGRDKAGLPIGEECFLDCIEKNLAGAGEILLSVQKKMDYPERKFKHVEDIYKNCGPLGGIHAALKVCKYPLLFVVACDMPCVDWEVARELQKILEESPENLDAVIPVGEEGQVHGLGGIYRKQVAEVIQQYLESGGRSVQKLLKMMQVRYIPVRLLNDGQRKLKNINTLEDYRKFMREIDKEPQRASGEIPVYSVVGYSGSGKTTFLEKLIPELKKRGLRVALVKHDGHDFEIDREGKDSWRLTRAGADVTALISAGRAALMENRPLSPEELLAKINHVDVILTEGFKKENWPKILVYRKAAGKAPAADPKDCFAVVSDMPFEGNDRLFALDDAASVAGLIADEVM